MLIMNKKVAFYTLGCKLNYSETSAIGRQMEQHGFTKVEFNQTPDVYVINTCSVTENADKKCKKIVKEALKFSPNAYIVVVGCYAQLKPAEIANIKGVDLVLGAAEKFVIYEHLKSLVKEPKGKYIQSPVSEVNFFVNAYSAGERTRSFLKIQDGCDYKCSFCTIPLARGQSRSDSLENIIKNANEIIDLGVKEIVLTGINIGDYGKNIDKNSTNFLNATFLDVVKALDEVPIERIRISSIEPNLLTPDIIEFISKSKRFMPHFHIPLQSGCNKILKAMRRRYVRELYAERVLAIKQVMPHACIGVDVIVGFPGESDEDFKETYTFLNQLDVSYLHVFTYSERSNTHAINLNPVVPLSIRHERSQMLHILSDKKRHQFYQQHVNTKRYVLFEAESDGITMSGFTDNYIKVSINYDPLLVNEIEQVNLLSILPTGQMHPELLH